METKEKKEVESTWNAECRTLVKKNKNYSTICGEISVDSPSGDAEKKDTAKVFYTAYLSSKKRPIMFLFNGGPGGGSVWLHLGGFGPKRVQGLDVDSKVEAKLVDNKETLLSKSDLVFVDPIGTGLSTYKDEETLKDFCTEKADASYLAQFISRFMNQHKRWGHTLHLCGESYGGYRVALLAYELITKHDIHPTGIFFVAPFLSGAGLTEADPNVIAEANFLCGYAVSAWYHKKSSLNQSCKNESSAHKKAKEFIFEKYLPARLLKNTYELDKSLLKKLSDYIGISVEDIKKEGINITSFCNKLFPNKNFAGRIDSRYTLEHPMTLSPYLDASCLVIGSKLTPHINAYLINQIGWETKERYLSLSEKVNKVWRFEDPFSELAFASLRAAMKLAPKMFIYAAGGYYDLAVPMSCVEYDLKQLADTESLSKRIHVEAFPAGHMMYVQDKSRVLVAKSILSYL